MKGSVLLKPRTSLSREKKTTHFLLYPLDRFSQDNMSKGCVFTFYFILYLADLKQFSCVRWKGHKSFKYDYVIGKLKDRCVRLTFTICFHIYIFAFFIVPFSVTCAL